MHLISRKRPVWLLLVLVSALPHMNAGAVSSATAEAMHVSAQGYLHYSLGRLMEVQGMSREALVQYQRAASFLQHGCELGRAEARAQLALGRLDDALHSVTEAEILCPNDLELLALHAEVCLARGEPTAAESLLIKAASRAGSPSRLTALLGQAQMSQGKAEEAVITLSTRAAGDTLNPGMAFLHARSLAVLGRSQECIQELQRAYRLEPSNAATVALLGQALLRAGRYAELISFLEEVTRSLTARQDEFVSLARAYAASERYEEALIILAEAEQTWGESEQLLAARGSVELASGAEELGMQTFERILVLEPDSVVALNFIAYHWAEQGANLDTALEYAARAAELVPLNPRVRDTLGWTYLGLGRHLDAIRELEAAVDLGGSEALIHEHLGDAYLRVGRTADAAAAWLRALELEPQRASTLERMEQIRRGSASSD